MSRNLIFVILIASLSLGFLGGALSTRFLTLPKLTTRYIEIVDSEGKSRIKLYTSPRYDLDVGIEGDATIEVLRSDQSLFSVLSTRTNTLSFHSRDNFNQCLILDPNIISWNDEKTHARLYIGHMRNESFQKKYNLSPYSLIAFNNDFSANWKIPITD